ncbi:uncharacterized protein yc1106_06398 [Curvularia clavata]|uniref:Uncharacterized protein n=1 Tax=Curvularia clavata TaxID=95742 RepID=A0A9Q8ZAP8_CURCL|nr:uncharacterized protein yc1106_06398 [Curvularia clavata]
MEFPASQLQAGVALTMFSPDVVPALYGQLNSEQSTNRNRGRDTRKSIGEGDSELHEHGGKSNLKKLGDLFKRKPYGSLSRSSRTAIQRSHEEQEASYLRELGPPQILSLEDSAYPEDTWATFIEADSEISHNKRLGTLEIEKRNDDPESSGRFRSHQRGKSFHVNFTPDDVQRIAKEIYDQTIADVHLSLFSYWINESEEHYEEAKRHIRELRLDHGYNLARIANVHLRKLMQDVFDQRPVYAKPSKQLSLRRSPGIPNLRDPGTDWCHKGLEWAELAFGTLSPLPSDSLVHALDSNTSTSIVRD